MLPDEAVALEKLNVPWLGAEDCDQVSVWLLSLSLTWSRLTILVAEAFWSTLRVVVEPTKVGEVLPGTVRLLLFTAVNEPLVARKAMVSALPSALVYCSVKPL